jgi:hypothetical protein
LIGIACTFTILVRSCHGIVSCDENHGRNENCVADAISITPMPLHHQMPVRMQAPIDRLVNLDYSKLK